MKESESRVILGVDPGTRITGYGLINARSNKYEPLDFGTIRPAPKLPMAERYLVIFEGILSLIEKYQPIAMAIETQFVYKNVQSAMKLGMARCAAMLAAAKMGIPVYEYAPTKAKLAVAGNGGASKGQVQKMMQLLLNLSAIPEPEDAADALSLAVCHAHTEKQDVRIRSR
ncbi:MAG: crossover junction endodeoxyribonuclease RuvC [Chlamydiales bacterium]|nr:crossover junction endodeoxyribonuclease RuvC [Chlamydiales bacterium]